MNAAIVSTNTAIVDLSDRYAGFWLRFVASFIDICIILVPVIAMSFLSDAIAGAILPRADHCGKAVLGLLLYYPMYYGLLIPFYAIFEASPLQATPGKLALGLIVTDLEGNRLTFWKALARNTGKILSDITFFTFSIGYLLAGFTQRKQALHDLMSECLVIRKLQ